MENPSFLIGDTSTQMVDFPVSYVSLLECIPYEAKKQRNIAELRHVFTSFLFTASNRFAVVRTGAMLLGRFAVVGDSRYPNKVGPGETVRSGVSQNPEKMAENK